jgi:hypothetical protein
VKPKNTIELVNPEDVRLFEKGTSIDDLSEEDARSVFGHAFYEMWREAKDNPRPTGTVTITGIGEGVGVITVSPSGGEGSEKK